MAGLATIQRNSIDAQIVKNRAKTWFDLEEYSKTIAEYEQAIRLDPDDVDAYLDLAWLLATCPDGTYMDGPRAVKLAQLALKLDAKHPRLTETLAAAHAEVGNYEEVVYWRTESLKSYFPQPHSPINPIILMVAKKE